MTEITRVPLQPVKKGSLSKIWVGALALALAGVGVAYAAMPAQVHVKTLTKGHGPSPTTEDMVLINYKGTLPDGKVFDEAKQVPMELTGVIPGFSTALQKMQAGGKYTVDIPSELAYGDKGQGEIAPNTDLTFEIELLDFRSKAEIEQQQRMMQQMMQMQQMQGGAPGAPEAPSE
ncbi:FKBP-type peptidyl-prolyl cis-trans isomerase [Novosphingobium decolorationis]|uniref:Peptidyl-prolyl cis-trans isomerase n=1 Tax=Novosphingobium decolorationis TaxID=2698673 RepID=A0ABX8E5B4_9SPHN|nr:FKBP-type peptidyl-prolyl cis-trans isomerase [Novosphingobium decolorationis]QVM83381.1 FKBP-type peptidyl-prolyl cis-trans isomerase [Novosphingobium decolorationis]